MTTCECKIVCLVFAAPLLIFGCDRNTTSSGPVKPAGPSIKELPEEAKLLEELIDTDACVCAFSGTCLEVWLECEVKEGEVDQSDTHSSLPVVITRHKCQWAETPEDISGKIIVWGDIMKSPAIRILVKKPTDDGLGASVSNRTLSIPPPPKELGMGGSSGGGFRWECPSELPGDGEEFTITSFSRAFHKYRGELPDRERVVIRESTLRLKGRCLSVVDPEPAPEEETAVATLRKVGARVFLEGFKGDNYEGRPKGNVKRINFQHKRLSDEKPQVSDADLACLRQLPKLESLSLVGTQVSDAGLVHLQELANLRTLDLWGTEVTDAGLVHLEGLSGLQTLNLHETQVGDQGLAHLSELTGLRELRLYRTRLTDAGLEHLRGLSNLETLHLANTRVSDTGLEHVKELTKLRELFLGHTRISDIGLERLKGLTKLQWLSVSDTQVTDAGLEHLKGLSNLKLLNLGGPEVTDEGVAKIQLALPHCEILVQRTESE